MQSRHYIHGVFSFCLIILMCQEAFASSENVLFKAFVQSSMPASTGVLPFESGGGIYNVGGGWNNEEHKFIAPITGHYHFDVGVRLSTTSLNATCVFMVKLSQSGGGGVSQQFQLFEMRTHSTNVSNQPGQFSWRPSGQMLSGNGGLDTYLREGAEVQVSVSGSNRHCYDPATLEGKSVSGHIYPSFFNGHLIASQSAISEQASDDDSQQPDGKKFDLVITELQDSKVQVIKILHANKIGSLKELKQKLDEVPAVVLMNQSLAEVNTIAAKLQAVGAITQIVKSK